MIQFVFFLCRIRMCFLEFLFVLMIHDHAPILDGL